MEIGHKGRRRGEKHTVQALVQLLVGFIVMLATAALAQFGVSLDRGPEPRREVHRVADCGPSASLSATTDTPRDC